MDKVIESIHGQKLIISEPGNSTRYSILLLPVSENLDIRAEVGWYDTSGPIYLVWLATFPATSRAYTFRANVDLPLHWGYVKEKLDLRSEEDAKQVTRILAEALGREGIF